MASHWAWYAIGLLSGLPLAFGLVKLFTGHRHRWVIVSAQPRPPAGLIKGTETTAVLWGCRGRACSAIHTTVIDGRWRFEEGTFRADQSGGYPVLERTTGIPGFGRADP